MCSFGSCQTRFEFLSQFRKVRNAFECFVTQVQTQFAKNQTRLAYEDKRDLYCILSHIVFHVINNNLRLDVPALFRVRSPNDGNKFG